MRPMGPSVHAGSSASARTRRRDRAFRSGAVAVLLVVMLTGGVLAAACGGDTASSERHVRVAERRRQRLTAAAWLRGHAARGRARAHCRGEGLARAEGHAQGRRLQRLPALLVPAVRGRGGHRDRRRLLEAHRLPPRRAGRVHAHAVQRPARGAQGRALRLAHRHLPARGAQAVVRLLAALVLDRHADLHGRRAQGGQDAREPEGAHGGRRQGTTPASRSPTTPASRPWS